VLLTHLAQYALKHLSVLRLDAGERAGRREIDEGCDGVGFIIARDALDVDEQIDGRVPSEAGQVVDLL
jgi:hypothetical protein